MIALVTFCLLATTSAFLYEAYLLSKTRELLASANGRNETYHKLVVQANGEKRAVLELCDKVEHFQGSVSKSDILDALTKDYS